MLAVVGEGAETKVVVEAHGSCVARAHAEVHSERPLGAECTEHRIHQFSSTAGSLGAGEKVDVQVRWKRCDWLDGGAHRAMNCSMELLVPAALVTEDIDWIGVLTLKWWPPMALAKVLKPDGVVRPDDVASHTDPILVDEREIGLEREIAADPHLPRQLGIVVEVCAVGPCVGGA